MWRCIVESIELKAKVIAEVMRRWMEGAMVVDLAIQECRGYDPSGSIIGKLVLAVGYREIVQWCCHEST